MKCTQYKLSERQLEAKREENKVEVGTVTVSYEEITMAGAMVVTSRYNDVDVEDITITSWED